MNRMRLDPEELREMLGPDCNVSLEKLEQLCTALEGEIEKALQRAADSSRRQIRLHVLKYHTAMAMFGEVFDPDLGTEEWRRLRAN